MAPPMMISSCSRDPLITLHSSLLWLPASLYLSHLLGGAEVQNLDRTRHRVIQGITRVVGKLFKGSRAGLTVVIDSLQ
jgi:hypothetical protein